MWLAGGQGTERTTPVTCCLDCNRMNGSITQLTLLVHTDLDSITELTCPVCLTFFENIKNNKHWVTSHLSPRKFSFILGILLAARSETHKKIGRLPNVTDHSQTEAFTASSKYFSLDDSSS